MNVIHGSSRSLARAIRRTGPFVQLRRSLKRFTTSLHHWQEPVPGGVDWTRDILLAYPDQVTNAPANYEELKAFYRGNKYEQWQKLKEFFKTPELGERGPWVQRPLRHEGGDGFVVTNVRPPADHDANYYYRSLWHRSSEYRVFFVKGQKVLTMLKRVPEGTRQDVAWNHGVSSFVTVHDETHDRLRHTKFYEKAQAFFARYPFHLCAVDVLYHDCKHRVVEVNFSPGVLIPDNLQSITTALHASHDTSNRLARAA